MIDEEKGRGPTVLIIGAIATVVLIGAIYLIGHFAPSPKAPAEQPLPMGGAEQAYAPQIHFLDPKATRAANMLNQQVTYILGTVSNDGSRGVRQIEVQLEFHDLFNQVVLRDKARLFSDTAIPLAPNGHRDFQLGYETLPAQWNQAYPTIKITGLSLQ